MVSGLLVAFVASGFAGVFGSMLGIGGGLIIVPTLTILLGYDVKTATAASLIAVIGTSLAASPRYIRSGIADRRLALVLLVGAALGGLAGGVTSGLVDGRLLALAFAILLALVAAQMLRQIRHPRPPLPPDPASGTGFISSYVEPTSGQPVTYQARRIGPGVAVSFLAGNVSGLLGVGGGIINVPTMNVLMRVPIRVATTTSTYMLAATAGASALVRMTDGQVDPLLVAPVALGVIVGARLGARLSMRFSQNALRLAFVLLAGIFSIGMFGQFLTL